MIEIVVTINAQGQCNIRWPKERPALTIKALEAARQLVTDAAAQMEAEQKIVAAPAGFPVGSINRR